MATPLRKYLQSFTPDELIDEVLKLSKKFKAVKAYYDMELGDAT